jgi:hypothetical protein
VSPTTLAALNAVLAQLAIYFLATTNNDPTAARQAAHAMLADYRAETTEEIHLAAAIISFTFQALDALAQAAAPDQSLNRQIRLRGSAVSLSREAHKARRKLDNLHRVRQASADPPEARAAPAQPRSQPSEPTPQRPAPALNAPVGSAPAITTTAATAQTWPLTRQQRRAAERAAAKLQRRSAEQARREALRTDRIAV